MKTKEKIIRYSHYEKIEGFSSGKFISNQMRPNFAIRFLITDIFEIFKKSTGIFTGIYFMIAKNKNFIFIIPFLFLYIFFLYKIIAKNLKRREEAWAQTSDTTNIALEHLQQTITIRQNLQKHDFCARSYLKEYESWKNYIININFQILLLNLIWLLPFIYFVFFFVFETTYSAFAVIFWVWIRNIISASQIFRQGANAFWDLAKILKKEGEIFKKKHEICENLKLSDVCFLVREKKFGPINFSLKKGEILALKGKNGAGKTRLCLAIADIIECEGIISRPSLRYIHTDEKNIGDLGNGPLSEFLNLKTPIQSKGERAVAVINNALIDEPRLLIADEVLDCIEEDLLNKIWPIIIRNVEMIILVSHNERIIDKADKIFDLAFCQVLKNKKGSEI